MHSSSKILKVGGSVLKDNNGFQQLLEIISLYNGTPLVLVISAFASATRNLKSAAQLAVKRQDSRANAVITNFINEHIYTAEEIIHDHKLKNEITDFIHSASLRLSEYIKGISITRELTPRTLDAVMSYGELFALRTVSAFLSSSGLNIKEIESKDLIVTDNNFGNARPLIRETAEKINSALIPEMSKDKIIITQGFVAATAEGAITTMGIESSNLTATLLAELTGNKDLTLWTDVEGIRSADPKIAQNTAAIPHLDYSLAYKAATHGLKLIYPAMIHHAQKNSIRIEFKSAFKPKGAGTVVEGFMPSPYPPMIILSSGLSVINIEFSKPRERAFAYDTIQQLKSKNNAIANIMLFPDSITLTVQNPDALIPLLDSKLSFSREDGMSVVSLFNIYQPKLIDILPELHKKYSDNPRFIVNGNSQPAYIIMPDLSAKDALCWLHDKLIK